MTTHSLSLAGIDISREDALELINRMNKNWPGKYFLEWSEPLYGNAMANPFIPQQYGQQVANTYIPDFQ